MNFHYLLRAVGAEALKLKRSLALLAAVLIPLVSAFVNFMITVRRGIGEPALGVTSPWSTYFLYAMKLWVIFALPLVVSLLAALLANVDHRAGAWKQLFGLSFPRSALFTGKWTALAGLTLLSALVFGAANLVGATLIALHPGCRSTSLPVPILEAFTRPLVAWMLSLFIVAIHLWIGLRWSSFLVSITAGFAASISNIFLLSSSLYDYSIFSPWAMPVQAYDQWQPALIASLVGAAVVYSLARRGFVHRDVFL